MPALRPSRVSARAARSRRMVLVAAAAALATAATACGTTTKPGGSGIACDSPGFTSNTVKIGYLYPDTGPFAQALLATRSGFIARVEQQNAAGGVHGRKIITATGDDQGDNGTNLQAARQLVDVDQVFGIVEGTVAASGGADLLRQQNVPVVGLPAESIWADHSYPNMFAHAYVYAGANAGSVDTFGQFVKAQGGRKVAVIGTDVSAASNQLDGEIVDSLRAVGVEISTQTFIYNAVHTDPVALGRQLMAAGVDTAVGSLSAQDFSHIMMGAKTAGANIRIYLSASGYDHSVLAQDGRQLAGLYTWLNYLPFEANTPADQTFFKAMSDYAPELQPPDQELALIEYILTDMFITGLEHAPACPTRADFISTLRNLTGYTADGLLPGPVDFKNWGRLSLCYTFVRVNDAGTGYDIVKDPAGKPEWCGNSIR
ncbi:ABC transporter substrate-binding protein [Frankia sp. AgB1.9]|nr:ABC transporter substrate-binding protein [Frankia sp. AgW1.1]MBL7546985.1 ABC transporter substrate-binding protein [Frankia sp. AgB1.9]MBL7625120.1 ABC transporter substrate-binding protein [Frankia sp. AgB1.8]